MKKPVLVAIVFAVIVLFFIVYSSMNLSGHKVEVCIAFKGQSVCRTAAGETEEDARRAAINNVCGELASGVTESLACENTQPTSVRVIK